MAIDTAPRRRTMLNFGDFDNNSFASLIDGSIDENGRMLRLGLWGFELVVPAPSVRAATGLPLDFELPLLTTIHRFSKMVTAVFGRLKIRIDIDAS